MASLHVAIYESGKDAVPHWSLYTMDDSGNEMIYEALGPTGGPYKYNTRHTTVEREEDISESPRVGRIEADVWPSIAKFLNGLPMGGSGTRGWNCQSWVMEAISALRGEGYLEEDEEGIDRVKLMYQRKWRDYDACAKEDESSWW